jgi:glycosyltransferase involved in cell wall biosynthesis
MSRGAADTHTFRIHEGTTRSFIAIGIPSFGMVHLFFAARLLNLRMPMNRVIRWFYVVGKEVGHARNEIVEAALSFDDTETVCSHVLFLDDDVLFHPEALNKLLSNQRDIVSGLYYAKSQVPTPLVLHGDYGGLERDWTPGDLVECEGHGMGLTLINADVFRRLRDETPLGVDDFGKPNWFTTTRDKAIVTPNGVDHAIVNQTEDMAFLTRAKTLGYKPAVDTSSLAFGWHFDAKRMTGYPQKQWKQFCETGSVTWDTKQGPITWEAVA